MLDDHQENCQLYPESCQVNLFDHNVLQNRNNTIILKWSNEIVSFENNFDNIGSWWVWDLLAPKNDNETPCGNRCFGFIKYEWNEFTVLKQARSRPTNWKNDGIIYLVKPNIKQIFLKAIISYSGAYWIYSHSLKLDAKFCICKWANSAYLLFQYKVIITPVLKFIYLSISCW